MLSFTSCYAIFYYVSAMTSFFTDLMPFLACWRAAKLLHAIMLDNVLKAPLQFFEVTPVGRLLSRFSKDVDTVDTSLAWEISSVLNSVFEVNKKLCNFFFYFSRYLNLKYLYKIY